MNLPETVNPGSHHHGGSLPVPGATPSPGPRAGDPAPGHQPSAPAGSWERGDRVALEHTSDPYTRLRPGDEGTVTRYAPDLGQLDVARDSGSTLSMLLDEGDRVRLITPATGETGTEPGE